MHLITYIFDIYLVYEFLRKERSKQHDSAYQEVVTTLVPHQVQRRIMPAIGRALAQSEAMHAS